MALGSGLIALGVFMLSGISEISFGAGYDRIGPRFFPYVVAIGLVLLGTLFILSTRRALHRPQGQNGEPAPEIDVRPLALIGLGLLLGVVLMERIGFIVASALQFWLVARAFHSRRPARDAAVAALLAASVYAVFSYGLGLSLPTGILGLRD